jgi:hypothetical protein
VLLGVPQHDRGERRGSFSSLSPGTDLCNRDSNWTRDLHVARVARPRAAARHLRGRLPQHDRVRRAQLLVAARRRRARANHSWLTRVTSMQLETQFLLLVSLGAPSVVICYV